MSKSNGDVNLLGRNEIVAHVSVRYRDVLVPEWGGTVRVRGLTGHERDEVDEIQAKADGDLSALRSLREKLVTYTAIDAEGKPIFNRDDVGVLAGKEASVLDRLVGVVFELSGMKKGAVDEAEKNFESGRPDGSGTA